MLKEKKIATYSEESKRIQLLEITEVKPKGLLYMGGKYYLDHKEVKYAEVSKYYNPKYQIRVNRRIKETTSVLFVARKKFASIITSKILQQKFSF